MQSDRRNNHRRAFKNNNVESLNFEHWQYELDNQIVSKDSIRSYFICPLIQG